MMKSDSIKNDETWLDEYVAQCVEQRCGSIQQINYLLLHAVRDLVIAVKELTSKISDGDED